LVDAAKADDLAGLLEILGPSSAEVYSMDVLSDSTIRHDFAVRAAQHMKVVVCQGQANARVLLTGWGESPLPFPIIRITGKWYFDTFHSSHPGKSRH